jgi:hypothetical protein
MIVAMPHARDAAARAFAVESCAVVAHLDVDVLAGLIQSGLNVYAGRVGVLHDVSEGLLQGAQNMHDILWRQASKPRHLPHLPVEIDALVAQAVVKRWRGFLMTGRRSFSVGSSESMVSWSYSTLAEALGRAGDSPRQSLP